MVDVIVTWEDGTENCVSLSELQTVNKDKKITLGAKVKMFYEEKWYYGTVTVTETSKGVKILPQKRHRLESSASDSSQDTVPLSVIKKNLKISNDNTGDPCGMSVNNTLQDNHKTSDEIIINYNVENDNITYYSPRVTTVIDYEDVDISDLDDPEYRPDILKHQELDFEETHYDRYIPQSCEVNNCQQEVFSSCFHCSILLCFDHFEENISNCTDHGQIGGIQMNVTHNQEQSEQYDVQFPLEGSAREYSLPNKKRVNLKKQAKLLRNTGQEYISPSTKKLVPKKSIGSRCNINNCQKNNRECFRFTDYDREQINKQYYEIGNIQSQREYLLRHIKVKSPRQKTVSGPSRRNKTFFFYLNYNNHPIKVCRKFFLNTLAISEKVMRTAVEKVNSTGILENEKRGGRKQILKDKDAVLRHIVENHINKFPRVESHYCRADTTRQYLHHDLSVKKMHRLLLNEYSDSDRSDGTHMPGLTLYKSVFKSMNLSFHRPKKDQCSLCTAFKEGSTEAKDKLREKYSSHISEKETVRKLKEENKKSAKENKKIVCASFDLQQVIYLPASKEGAIFYKRRLSVYNFTMYNISTRECLCFTWPETESKRGSSEISTAVTIFLKECDEAGVETAYLYADGCAGQNKNSIMACALLKFINNCSNISNISLRYFAPNHGQNEGDSAHSAISYALKKAGDIFLPSQLYPIMKMARSSQPYDVRPLEYKDFKNYKDYSRKLKILSLRKDDCNKEVNWTEISEVNVRREYPTTIFFKTSHTEEEYRSISIKRTETKFLKDDVPNLNFHHQKISKLKYADLLSLCSGSTAIIRLQEYKNYYERLPHE